MAANKVWAMKLVDDDGDKSVWENSVGTQWVVRPRMGTNLYEVHNPRKTPRELEGLYTRKIDAEIALNNYAIKNKKVRAQA